MRRWALAAVLFFLLGPGSSMGAGFDLLRIDTDARGAALGSFPVAFSTGRLDAVGVNPAGLAGLTERAVSLTYADHPLDLASGRAVWAQPLFGGVGGVDLTWFSYGQFDRRTDFDSPADGEFGASDLMLGGSWAISPLENIALGGSLRLLHGRIDEYTSTAVSLDAGALLYLPLQRATLALTVANLGTQLESYGTTSEDLPLTLRAGGARKLEHLPLVLGVTAHYELDGELFGTASGEFTVSERLQVRAGYSTRSEDLHVSGPDDSLAGLSAGFAVSHSGLRLHYALHSQGALGLVHRVAVEYTLR